MMNTPRNAPTVRQMKYTCGAMPACSVSHPKRSIMTFELMKLVATSIPTTKKMPKKSNRMVRSDSSPNTLPTVTPVSSFFSWGMGVK